MKPLVNFHPFRIDGSWYVSYWSESAPVQSTFLTKCLLRVAAIFWQVRQHPHVKCLPSSDTDYEHGLHRNIEARG
jgi:hypothetical protein